MKNKVIIVFFILFAAFSLLTFLLEYFEKKIEGSFLLFLSILVMPGFILYVILTGDIHGWQPGPIGQSGRVIVTGFGSAIFWTIIFYFAYRKKIKAQKPSLASVFNACNSCTSHIIHIIITFLTFPFLKYLIVTPQ